MSTPKDPIREEVLRIEKDCIHSGKAHFNAADRWNAYHMWIGLPAVALSALASTAFFTEEVLIGSLLSGSVAILTALQTFMKPSERASSHKSAGDQYLSLRNDGRIFRRIRLDHVCDDQAAIDGLEEISKRRNELNLASPSFTNRDFKKALRGINAGEATHAVDKEK